uniref:Uncharacterized protein n=1 Tax=Rhizophora mucronata TaxID=61149 RepID=A0A2P2R3B6_RHIMU
MQFPAIFKIDSVTHQSKSQVNK